MADGKIYITISDKRLDEKSENGGVGQDQDKDKKGGLGLYVKHQTLHFLQQQAMQGVNYAISNIGNFTGDYQSQRVVQQAVSNFNLAKGIGMSTIAGFKVGGVVGAMVGATISTASIGINIALNEITNNRNMAIQNRNINQLRKISGLDNLTNGSRGTNS